MDDDLEVDLMRHVTRIGFAATLLFVAIGAAPGAERAVVDGDVGKQLDEYLTRLEDWGFSGAILSVRDGKVVLSAGYGWADAKTRAPATSKIVWNTGSITKQFTAAAILKLEMQGKLHIEDPISKYFTDAPPD